MIDVKLKLIFDIDMYQLVERRMRGGISYITQSYSKANNKYMPPYNSNESSKYKMFEDANKLERNAISGPFPTDESKMIRFDKFDLKRRYIGN